MADIVLEEDDAAVANTSRNPQERKKSSTVWTFFTVDDDNNKKAICHKCKEKISRGGSNPRAFGTSNLIKHLQIHKEIYEEYLEIERKKKDEEKSTGKGLKQATLEQVIDKQKPYSIDHPRAKSITSHIAEMMAVDLQPFSIVDNIGFCRLMALIEPRYTLPSRRYFSEVMIPAIYSKVKHHVSQLLSSTTYVSVTTDAWSSTYSHHSFMSLTAHFITDTMEKKDLMLSAWQFDESHTADNISVALLSHIQSWDIEEKLVCAVRDNAANMIAGMRVAHIPSLPCLAHSLQLIIKNGVFHQPAVQQLLSCARSIVGHYHRSNTAFQLFAKIQSQLDLPKHCLIQDVPTRWNSSYYMLERLVEQKKAITAANTECQPPAELRAQQWTLAEKVVQVLKIFEEATREVSGNYSSAAVIIPIINTLKQALVIDDNDTGIMAMKRGMCSSLEGRYGDVEQNPLCALSTVLDPRFKMRAFSTAANAACARMLLTKEYEELLSQDPSIRVCSDDQQPQAKRLKEGSSSLWSMYSEMLAIEDSDNTEGSSSSNTAYTAEMAVEMYLKDPTQSLNSSPLEYWKQKKALWPILARLASKYLSIPPSSASSERLFSSAADIITQERNKLLPEKSEMLLFINKNLPLLEFKY